MSERAVENSYSRMDEREAKMRAAMAEAKKWEERFDALLKALGDRQQLAGQEFPEGWEPPPMPEPLCDRHGLLVARCMETSEGRQIWSVNLARIPTALATVWLRMAVHWVEGGPPR